MPDSLMCKEYSFGLTFHVNEYPIDFRIGILVEALDFVCLIGTPVPARVAEDCVWSLKGAIVNAIIYIRTGLRR